MHIIPFFQRLNITKGFNLLSIMARASKKLLRNRLTIPLTPFYRRYPYAGGLAIDSADARGCVDIQMKFFCNRIPKAANSTVVTTLARIRFDREITSKQAKKMFLTPALLHNDEVQNLDNFFRFVFVRNPFTRTLSAYLDKVERRAVEKNKPSSFKSFLYQLEAGRLHSNAHWAPQYNLLLIPVDQFDFIGRTETFDADMLTVKNRLLGKRSDEPVKSVLSNATNAKDKLDHYYDDETIELVRTLYRQDFEIFDYPLNLPGK